MTYQELNVYVNHLASSLALENTKREEPIGILVPMGIMHVAAQIAVLRLAGSCVPIDPSFPDQRIKYLLHAANVRVVITVPSELSCLEEFQTIVLRSQSQPTCQEDSSEQIVPAVETGKDHRTHILHTSGSTGLPKRVEILSKGIT